MVCPARDASLLQILQMGPSVTLSERVNVVDIADDLPRRLGELGAIQARKESPAFQPSVNIGHAGFDEFTKLEGVAVLGDLDRADLAGPTVNVLEEMSVDRPKVDQIEVAAGRTLSGSLCDEFPLQGLQPHGVPDTKAVYEDV